MGWIYTTWVGTDSGNSSLDTYISDCGKSFDNKYDYMIVRAGLSPGLIENEMQQQEKYDFHFHSNITM